MQRRVRGLFGATLLRAGHREAPGQGLLQLAEADAAGSRRGGERARVGKYRRGRERQPMVGMLVRLDASTHERGLSIASIQRIATGVSSATCSMTPMLQRLSTVRGSKARNSVLLFSGREIGVKYFSSEVRRAGVERDADEQRHDSSRPSVGLDVRFQHSVHARLVPSGLSKTGPSKIRMASSKSMACLAILAAFLAMCHSNAIQV